MINFLDKNNRWITYFHIPKTGGSSIVYGFFSNGIINPDKELFFDGNRRLKFNAWHYNDSNKYADHFTYLAAKQLGYTIHEHSIAFVRNPWKRCVSHYLFIMKKQYLGGDRIPFSEWLAFSDSPDGEFWQPYYSRPQYKYLINEQGEIAVSQVYKLEDTDLAELFSGLLGKKLPRKKFNVLPSYDYRSFYTDELIEKVANIYAKDIELFNYKYE